MRLRYQNIEKLTESGEVIRELLARGYEIVPEERGKPDASKLRASGAKTGVRREQSKKKVEE